MLWPILQACEPKKWANGSWKACSFDPVIGLVGEPMFGLLMGGPVIVALYVAGNGDLATPTVVLLLLAALMVPLLPASAAGVAYTFAFLGVVSGFMAIARRYILGP